MRRRVVITGIGVLSAAGDTIDRFWTTLVEGRSCVGPIARFDASPYPSRIAAEIGPLSASQLARWPGPWNDQPRIAQFAMMAAGDAVADASLSSAYPHDRIGVSMATGMGTYVHDEVFPACACAGHDGLVSWDLFASEVLRRLRPGAADRRTPGTVSARIAEALGFEGPTMSAMTACAAGTQAIGDAVRWIRLGHADAAVAGGADSELYPMGLASFSLLGALSTRNDEPTRASRPFDVDRDGFIIGEGAGAVALEERDAAIRRGARIYAEIAGFGAAADAWRATDPHPEAEGAVLAMRRAMADAKIPADRIGYVNAHGTSTPANDRVEALSLHRVFGDRARALPVSSTKSMIGHATVAAGAIEAVVTALTLDRQIIHPTINVDRLDPDCHLDVVPWTAREARGIEVALSNSFAFGGQIACLLLRRHA